jgi:hypothetical protein
MRISTVRLPAHLVLVLVLGLPLVIATTSAFIAGCSSQPIIPEAKNITLSRDDADKDCQEIGPVQGSVKTTTGKIEEAIEDMKLDAARKGANYVRMETTSAIGTSVSGTAYKCP